MKLTLLELITLFVSCCAIAFSGFVALFHIDWVEFFKNFKSIKNK